MRNIIQLLTILLLSCSISVVWAQNNTQPAVTFVEIGSTTCIPCRQMQPVMKAIEEKYAGQLKLVFHNVSTDEGKANAKKYKYRLIPTQVFLDANGKEFHRHEGYYPERQIDKILLGRGLKQNAGKK